MRVSRMSCAAMLQEEGRHAANKLRRVVIVKTTVKDSNDATLWGMRERLKAVI